MKIKERIFGIWGKVNEMRLYSEREVVIMSRKTKNIDHELCDYDEAYDRESASDIGWCGKCKIPECPYNKDLNEKRRMGWNP